MLILFPKLEPPWLLRWSLVPLPSYCQNSLHPVSQMETSHFHIPLPISTALFIQFLRWNWSFHAPWPICIELSAFAYRVKASYNCRKENCSYSAGGHLLQDLNHLFLDCLAYEPLCKSIFGSEVCTQVCGSTVGSLGSSVASSSSEGVGWHHPLIKLL